MATKTYTYGNDRGTLTLTVTVQSQSTTANTSTCAWSLVWTRGANKEFWNAYDTGWSVSGAVAASGVWRVNVADSTVTLGSGTFTAAHNDDGTKTISEAFNVALKSPAEATGTQTLTVMLPTIARASTVQLLGSPVIINGTNSLGVNIYRASDAFTHTLVWKLGTRTYTQTGVATSAIFTPPAAWLDQISTAMQAIGNLSVTTFNGSAQIGSPVNVIWMANVPDGSTPDGVLTATRIDNNVPTSWGIYVQSQSGLRLDLTNVTVSAGATLKSWTITTASGYSASGTGTSGTLTVDKLPVAGTRTYEALITDSRGSTKLLTGSIAVVAWLPPQMVSASVTRADSSGTPNPTSGTSIRGVAQWTISSVGGKNSLKSATLKTGKVGSSWGAALNVTSGTVVVTNTGSVALADEWAAMWTITDQLGVTNWPNAASAPAASTQRVPASMMPISFYRDTATGKMGVALGDIATSTDVGRVRSAWPHLFTEPIRPGTTTNTVLGAGSLRYNASTDHLELLDSGGQWDQVAETMLTTATPTFSAASGWTITLDGYWQHSDSHQAFLRVLMSCSSAIA
ncbi:MAG: DUF859 domain-containing protein, partial [Propionibacteriaceae bacterium]|nr:DUF859 domain-containing protein [Propionibacteriaceae bacterium]